MVKKNNFKVHLWRDICIFLVWPTVTPSFMAVCQSSSLTTNACRAKPSVAGWFCCVQGVEEEDEFSNKTYSQTLYALSMLHWRGWPSWPFFGVYCVCSVYCWLEVFKCQFCISDQIYLRWFESSNLINLIWFDNILGQFK